MGGLFNTMKKKLAFLRIILPILFPSLGFAQTRKSLKLVEVFDAGQPQTIILKLYDDKADVLCYVLMPELASRKRIDSNWIYDANNIGSISCIKQLPSPKVTPSVKTPIVPHSKSK